MTQEQIQQLLDINVALSAERDREALLTYILDTAMDMTNCDGGTLYLLKDNALHFCRMVTRSFGIRQGGHDAPITLPPVPLKPSHVCARAVLENRLINVSDVNANTEFDFSGSKKYDELTGYCTRSMLVVPLANDYGELIGVLQLLNAQNSSGKHPYKNIADTPYPIDKGKYKIHTEKDGKSRQHRLYNSLCHKPFFVLVKQLFFVHLSVPCVFISLKGEKTRLPLFPFMRNYLGLRCARRLW